MRIRINDWLRPTAVLIGILLADFLFGFIETAHAQLATIEVAPNTATLQVGDQQVFTATGKDPEGNPVTLNNPVWEYTGGGVMIPSGNTAEYTATSPGEYQISCMESGTSIRGIADIHTTDPNQLATIEITPSTANLQVGDQQVFTATGKDGNGNSLTIPNPVWETSGGGTITPDGQNCTFTAAQVGVWTLSCQQTGTEIKDEASITVTATAVEQVDPMPTEFALYQNHPNPFNPETTIRYTVNDPCRVIMKVFDLRGREVATLVDRIHPSGFYSVQFDASGLASGIYFCRIRMKDFVAVKKMVLLE